MTGIDAPKQPPSMGSRARRKHQEWLWNSDTPWISSSVLHEKVEKRLGIEGKASTHLVQRLLGGRAGETFSQKRKTWRMGRSQGVWPNPGCVQSYTVKLYNPAKGAVLANVTNTLSVCFPHGRTEGRHFQRLTPGGVWEVLISHGNSQSCALAV